MRFRQGLAVVGALCLLASPAMAHPHVWAEMSTDLVFTPEGMVKGLAIAWTFDDAYAQEALTGMDTNHDGQYSDAELEPLTRENINALKDYGYFTLFRFNDAKQPLGDIDVKLAKNVWKDGKLTLLFFAPLKEALDPRKGQFEAKVFDPEYYVAIDYRQSKPFQVTGTPPAGCKVVLKAQQTDADLAQKKAFLAAKGKDWKPPPDEEFGEAFAQGLGVECATP